MLKFEESAKYTQEKLADAGYYSGKLDGLFGDVSKGALQRALTDAMSYKGVKPSAPSRNLTSSDINEAAIAHNLKAAHIRAVIEVESGGGWFTDMRADILNLDGPGGFIAGDMPKILFEALWFHRLTNGRFTASHPKISSNKWDKSLYVGGQNEYRRLHEAMLLDELAALKSASWGMFQIMGFNHQLAGYSLVTDFVAAMKKSEANHLAAFLSLITNSSYQGSKLIDLLRKNDFNGFAGGYNGEGQIALYGGKIATAFKKYS